MRAALRGAHKLSLMNQVLRFGVVSSFFVVLAACSSSSSSSTLPSSSSASVRFIDGSPLLQTLEGSAVQSICPAPSAPCYLQVNGKTVTQDFSYGTMTPFLSVPAGTLSLIARDELGYRVGPLKTTALQPGKPYTLIVVGAYPNYSVLTFAEPASNGDAQLSLYEASQSVPQADFGSFRASSKSDFKQLGSAKLGSVTTVDLGKTVTDFGAYVGPASAPLASVTPSQVNPFDAHNVLPFNRATRFSLFLFDPSATAGPLFGALDQ